jgi:hypothetical protein
LLFLITDAYGLYYRGQFVENGRWWGVLLFRDVVAHELYHLRQFGGAVVGRRRLLLVFITFVHRLYHLRELREWGRGVT